MGKEKKKKKRNFEQNEIIENYRVPTEVTDLIKTKKKKIHHFFVKI